MPRLSERLRQIYQADLQRGAVMEMETSALIRRHVFGQDPLDVVAELPGRALRRGDVARARPARGQVAQNGQQFGRIGRAASSATLPGLWRFGEVR